MGTPGNGLCSGFTSSPGFLLKLCRRTKYIPLAKHMQRVGAHVRIKDFCTRSKVPKPGQLIPVTTRSGLCLPTVGCPCGKRNGSFIWPIVSENSSHLPPPQLLQKQLTNQSLKKKNSFFSDNLTSGIHPGQLGRLVLSMVPRQARRTSRRWHICELLATPSL